MSVTFLRRRGLGNGSCKGIKAASKNNLLVWRSDGPTPNGIDTVIRWGCTSNVPQGCKVVNKSSAIHWVANKRASRIELANHGLAPLTWVDDEQPLKFPVVVRRATHHQGRYLHLCDDKASVRAATALYGPDNYYISEYIPKVAEYRVFVCEGRVVWVAQKTPANPDDIAWNVARGGRFDNLRWGKWPLNVVDIAIKAFNISKLDFGGVDVMVDEYGRAYVLEINSAPSQTSPYRQSCVARAFDWHIDNGWEDIPCVGGDNWRDYIHPSLTEEAKV